MANVFISTARQDASIALRLAEILRADGQTVFYDDSSLVAGKTFSTRIAKELSSAQAIVVLLSRNSVRSNWVEKEFRTALERGGRVIPVLLDEEATNNWVWPLISDRHAIRLGSKLGIDEVVRQLKRTGQDSPREYLKFLREETAYIDIRGLGAGSEKAHSFPIEDLYIPMQTAKTVEGRTVKSKSEEVHLDSFRKSRTPRSTKEQPAGHRWRPRQRKNDLPAADRLRLVSDLVERRPPSRRITTRNWRSAVPHFHQLGQARRTHRKRAA